ncbi:MAG: isochorismatase family cysteine hydrolase [Pseudomonadota bacterium]
MTKRWQKNMAQWPTMVPDFPIDPGNFALVIVDMQNYLWDPVCGLAKIIHEERPDLAKYYFPWMNEVVIPNHIILLEFFRNNDIPIIFLTAGPEREDGRDFLRLRQKASDAHKSKTNMPSIPVKGSYAHNIIAAIAPKDNEMVFNKSSRSAFTSTGLDQILRNMGLDTVAFTGAATNVCVETTARDAADRGYHCVLIEDACATFDEVSHNTTMQNFCRIFGKVKITNELIAELSAAL